MTRILLSAVALLALTACNQGAGNSATAAAPVKGATPPAGKAWADVVTLTPEGGVMQGNPNAPVKLVEYGSRTCGACARFSAEGMPALRSGPVAQGRLSVEFRDYPVAGALDLAPIVLGQCVDAEARWALIDQMMENQQTLLADAQVAGTEFQQRLAANANPSPKEIATFFAERLGYLDFVKARGLPEARARQCLADPKAYEQLTARFTEANTKYSVAGTPTFLINGSAVPNTSSWDALQPALRAAGAL